MSQRLPQPGGDNGDWGDILNAYLSVSLSSTGELNNNVVGTSQLQSNAVTAAQLSYGAVGTDALADGSVTNAKLDIATQSAIANANSALQSSQLGAASGIATLNSSSQLTASQLPSSVGNSASSLVYYGAPSGGDDTSGLQTALNALTAGQILTLESGQTYSLAGGTTLHIPTTHTDIGLDLNGGTIQATVSLNGPMIDSAVGSVVVRFTIRNGTLDCNGNAYNAFFPRFFQHITVDDLTVLTPLQHAVIFGDTSAAAVSYEAVVKKLHVWSTSGRTPPAGYAGVYYQYASDSPGHNIVVVGCDIGIWNAQPDNTFYGCHAWGHSGDLPSVCFYDTGSGAYYGCCADTPTTYGWHFTGSNKQGQIFGGTAVNGTYGGNNTADAIYVDSGTTVFVQGVNIVGATSSYNWATDITFAVGYVSSTYLPGIRTNVTSQQHTRIGSSFYIDLDADLLFDGATNTIGQSTYGLSPSAVYVAGGPVSTTGSLIDGFYAQSLATNGAVTFDASKGNHNQVTLGANATSSTIANAPSTSYNITQDLTLEIRQDGTGSRTFVPPTNIKWANGAAPTWSTTAGYTDIVVVTWDKGTSYWYEVSRSIGIH